jgi:hypothetical protein
MWLRRPFPAALPPCPLRLLHPTTTLFSFVVWPQLTKARPPARLHTLITGPWLARRTTRTFAYRSLTRPNICLSDAGQHAHTPVGVGFLRVPVADRGMAGGPLSVFVQTFYNPTIPGIIVSLSAEQHQILVFLISSQKHRVFQYVEPRKQSASNLSLLFYEV